MFKICESFSPLIRNNRITNLFYRLSEQSWKKNRFSYYLCVNATAKEIEHKRSQSDFEN